MKPLYDFGISQEDERTEAAALGLPGGRVLSIASAGDMPLSMLALGADQVTAVDIAPAQIALAELKRAAILALPAENAAMFLGFRPARCAEREEWLRAVLPRLPASAQQFWLQHQSVALGGAIWAGRFERYLGVVRQITAPLLRRRFERLCRAETLDEQASLFTELLDRPWLHALFTIVFAPGVYAGRGVDRRGLQHRSAEHSVGDRFFTRFRDMCMQTPASQNHLLQLLTLGHVIDGGALPAYLGSEGSAVVRARSAHLDLRVGSIHDALAVSPIGAFDRVHLSNVPDWLPPGEFHRLLALIAERGARPLRLVWRDLHCGASVGGALDPRIHDDRETGERLRMLDRFPLYTIHPAELLT